MKLKKAQSRSRHHNHKFPRPCTSPVHENHAPHNSITFQSLYTLSLSSVGLLPGRGRRRLLLVGHEPLKLVEVDPPVAVEVGLLDHGAHLAVRQRLPEVVHRQLQLLLRNEAVAVAVENPAGYEIPSDISLCGGVGLKRIRTENATGWVGPLWALVLLEQPE